MRIYLDNNATSPIHPVVHEAMSEALRSEFGNPSSVHREGQMARRALENARESVASLIGAAPREIVFTSGGTESNNAAIFGLVSPAKRSHIVTTSIEHPSALEPVRTLEQRGCRITRVGCDRRGRVDSGEMIAALGPETALVVMMLANNETGVVQPVEPVSRACRERGIPLHCDAVQAAGRIALDVESLGADTVALSAHKIQGPKGIGALWVRSGLTLEPLVVGGAQERRRRAGTESVPLAVGFGAAARLAGDPAGRERMAGLRERFESRVLAAIPDASINGGDARRIPNTSSLRFAGADAEALVIALDLRGIAVSTGSACSSGRVEPSRVLIEMGLSEEDAASSIRISLGWRTTTEEIDRLVSTLEQIVPENRRASARAVRAVRAEGNRETA
ncbi:MAG TPA: cysteine desulfurase family protein [Thermoanaerobaculia bacterium]|nr:cysteine desulfurase family protein [Thermoanaerobaculia bacterium]